MKVVSMVFSPTGNSLRAAGYLEKSLLSKKAEVITMDLTREGRIFREKKTKEYLLDRLPGHDILCLFAPVYAHHLQYHMKEIIRSLPPPNCSWGLYAIPVITYGGISSGIALSEAGALLAKTGRRIMAGMKINSMHSLTRLRKIKSKINEGMPGDEIMPLIERLAESIMNFALGKTPDSKIMLRKLNYQNKKVILKSKILFREKFWQDHIYPSLVISSEKCSGCGKCASQCPVQCINVCNSKISIINNGIKCIHCGLCVYSCPKEAIDFKADWEKWDRLLSKAAKGQGPMPSLEMPKSELYL